MMLAAYVLIDLVLLGQTVPPGPATQIPLRIEFEAPSGCSNADAFYSGVRARTPRVRAATPGERAHELRVRLTRAKGRVHGELTVLSDYAAPTPNGQTAQGANATRGVDGASCEEVAEALALTTALALDPDARLTPAPAPGGTPPGGSKLGPSDPAHGPERPPPGGPAPPPDPTARAPETPRTRDAASPRLDKGVLSPPAREEEPWTQLGFAFGVEALSTRVATTGTSFGASVSARLAYPVRGLGNPSLGISLFHVRDDLFGRAERASVHLSGVALSACPLRVPVWEGFTVSPCALALGGWLDAHAGRNLRDPTAAVRSWWSLGAELRGSAALGASVALELQAGLTFPLVKRRFAALHPDGSLAVISETPTVAPLVGLGLSWIP